MIGEITSQLFVKTQKGLLMNLISLGLVLRMRILIIGLKREVLNRLQGDILQPKKVLKK